METARFMASSSMPDLPEPPKMRLVENPPAPVRESAIPEGYKQPLVPSEVAAFLRVTPACVRKWAREGKLPSVRINREIYIPAQEFFDLMRLGGAGAFPAP